MGTARVKYHVLSPGVCPFLARLSPRSAQRAETTANAIKAVAYLPEDDSGTIRRPNHGPNRSARERQHLRTAKRRHIIIGQASHR